MYHNFTLILLCFFYYYDVYYLTVDTRGTSEFIINISTFYCSLLVELKHDEYKKNIQNIRNIQER